jgi:hypothetical protein
MIPKTQYRVYKKNPKIIMKIAQNSIIAVKIKSKPPRIVKSVLVVYAYIVSEITIKAVIVTAVMTISGGLKDETVATM